MQVGTNKENT